MGKSVIYRVVISLIVLVCTSILCFSQNKDTLSFSSTFEFDNKEYKAQILHSDTEVIVVKPNNQGSTIKFTVLNRSTFSTLDEFSWVSESESTRSAAILAVTFFQGNIQILSTSQKKKEQTESLWLTTINSSGEQLKAMEVDNKIVDQYSNVTRFELFKSDNEQYLGISAVNEAAKGNQFQIRLFLFNKDLIKLDSQVLKLPNIKKVSFPGKFILDNRGIVYFLNGLEDQKGDEVNRIGLEKRLYQLFRYNPTDETLKQYDVSIADKFISEVKMKPNLEGDLVVLGFYNNSFEKAAEGLFTMVIGKNDGSILLSGKKPFPPQLLLDFKNEKQAKKNPVIDNLFLDHIFFTDSGSIILLGEVFNVEQRLMQDVTGMNLTTSTYYNFDQILALEIDKNLGYSKHQTIFKRQKSINHLNPYWSYSVLNTDEPEKIKVIYNYVSPEEKKNAVTLTSEARTSTWCHTLFSSEAKKLVSQKELKIAPLFSQNFKNNTLILQDRNNYSLVNYNVR